ncbi:SufE family protein [Alteromonas aestuariivivens]|uniref:SufE family protein n=1 Tax=Alteromonas aestuariivivens TaxID=1938339 RepID=A0A3D8MB87_9ALTE|nr:SufE family protein [Alteromonas aestuariivivens]RDV27477.1 SufE family protein [Alteromonas aestuariivivens]
MNTQNSAQDLLPLARAVANARGWDEVTRQLMIAGRQLNTPESWLCVEEYAVPGCESEVWLALSSESAAATIVAYSPSKIVRGVLAILLEKANHQALSQLKDTDFSAYLTEIGLARHLSQSRGNGIREVIKRLNGLVG